MSNTREGQVYQQINWGWLTDYNGYKFAPNTFFEQLYTKEGKSFSQEYNQRWNDLSSGKFVAGAAEKLVKYVKGTGLGGQETTIIEDYNIGYPSPENNGDSGTYLGYYPIYFNGGVPTICEPTIASDIFGDVNNPNESVDREIKSEMIYAKQQILESRETIVELEEQQNKLKPIVEANAAEKGMTFEEYLDSGDIAIDNSLADYKGLEASILVEELKIVDNQRKIDNFIRNTVINGGIINGDTINGGIINGDTINGDTINGNTIKATDKFIGDLNGNADTATKLQNTSKIGSASIPVYFNNGQPIACNYPNKDNKWLGVVRVADWSSENEVGGVIDIGRYIDFHATETDEGSYTTRFSCQPTDEQIEIKLPSTSGTLALTSGTVENTNKIKVTRLVNADIAESPNYYLTAVNTYESGTRDLYVRNDIYITKEEGKSGAILMGAAWNDYAEFRDQIEIIEPGYCVASTDSGKVYKTNEKFQACDGIVSDTYGFAIGHSETYQTPLAVSGRVLAYCEGNRYNYHAGDTVCAGPEGKICKMTREEIKEYPDRIVGIVSEIPEYDEWNGKIINNRIWIKVK